MEGKPGRRPTKIPSSPKILKRSELTDEFVQLYAVATRVDDGLGINLVRTEDIYSLQVGLSTKVEELERAASASAIVMSEYFESKIDDDAVHLTYDLFDRWRRALRRSHNTAVAFANRSKAAYLRGQVEVELGLVPEPRLAATSVLALFERDQSIAGVDRAVASRRGAEGAGALLRLGQRVLDLGPFGPGRVEFASPALLVGDRRVERGRGSVTGGSLGGEIGFVAGDPRLGGLWACDPRRRGLVWLVKPEAAAAGT